MPKIVEIKTWVLELGQKLLCRFEPMTGRYTVYPARKLWKSPPPSPILVFVKY